MTVEILGIGVLILAIIFAALLIFFFRSLKQFVVNAIMGLIILFLANAVAGLGIGYSWLVILICGIGGTFGAVLVIVLHILGIAF